MTETFRITSDKLRTNSSFKFGGQSPLIHLLFGSLLDLNFTFTSRSLFFFSVNISKSDVFY